MHHGHRWQSSLHFSVQAVLCTPVEHGGNVVARVQDGS